MKKHQRGHIEADYGPWEPMKRIRQVLWFCFFLLIAILFCLLASWPLGIWYWLQDQGREISSLWRLAGKGDEA